MAEADDIKELALLDFSGGLNNTLDQTLIKDSELKVATNVFYDLHGAVEKRYGYGRLGSAPISALQGNVRSFYLGNAFFVTGSDSSGAGYSAWIWNGSSWNFARYTGSGATAIFTNGSATVTRASGTAEWTTQMAAGDKITADNGTTWYTILSVDTASQVTLTAVFAGSTTTVAVAVTQQLKNTPAQDAVAFGGYALVGPVTDPSSGTSGLMSLLITASGAGLLSTSARRVTSAPAFNLMAVHKNYVFGVNNVSATVPSRLFWSTLLDPTAYPAANFVDVSPNDGGIIRALVSYNDVLYIFKDNDIYYLTGEAFDPSNPTFALRKIVNPHRVGTIQGRSCRVYQGQIIFVGPDDIYAIQNGITIVPFGTNKIRGSILGGSDFFNSNPYWCAEVFDNKYWLAYSDTGSAANDVNFVLDKNGSWSKHNLPIQSMATDLSKQSLYFWDYFGFFPCRINLLSLVTNDNSAAISSAIESRVLGFGDFSKTTHVIDVYVAFKNTSDQAATITLYDDSGAIGTPTSMSFTGGSTKAFDVLRIPVERDTSGFYFKISDATVSKSFMFFGAIIVYTKDARGSGYVVT